MFKWWKRRRELEQELVRTQVLCRVQDKMVELQQNELNRMTAKIRELEATVNHLRYINGIYLKEAADLQWQLRA